MNIKLLFICLNKLTKNYNYKINDFNFLLLKILWIAFSLWSKSDSRSSIYSNKVKLTSFTLKNQTMNFGQEVLKIELQVLFYLLASGWVINDPRSKIG